MVQEGDKLEIEKIDREAGTEFDFEEVLLTGNGKAENAQIGAPTVAGAKVHARVLTQGRGEKKIVFKFHHKTRYKRKKGHRQPFTQVEILKILA